ncbi:hypothetical protein MKY66_22515 [Paenibacillus sp. FSL R5-0766]|uniref:hypothetical protein n=1 Tax=Paenibacillus sp. FSL R5-0766 TaxID=2921658 RepID=UPI0026B03AC3
MRDVVKVSLNIDIYHPVCNDGDAEGRIFTSGFGISFRPAGWGAIGSGYQLVSQFLQKALGTTLLNDGV